MEQVVMLQLMQNDTSEGAADSVKPHYSNALKVAAMLSIATCGYDHNTYAIVPPVACEGWHLHRAHQSATQYLDAVMPETMSNCGRLVNAAAN